MRIVKEREFLSVPHVSVPTNCEQRVSHYVHHDDVIFLIIELVHSVPVQLVPEHCKGAGMHYIIVMS